MTAWAKSHPVPLFFLVTLSLGLIMISSAAFTVSAFWGLLTSGVLLVGAGHWITYLRTLGGAA